MLSSEEPAPQDSSESPSHGDHRITAVHTRVLRVPYRRPFGISSGTSQDLISITVNTVSADGTVGSGETSPMTAYTGETVAGVRSALEEYLAPAIIGLDSFDISAAHKRMDHTLRGQRVAKAGIDLALHDHAARIAGRPVHSLLGGRHADTVASTWVVGLDPVDDVVNEAVTYAGRGFAHIKIKGGVDARRDVEAVRAVRSALPSEVALSIDANEGYDRTTAMRVLPRMADAGLDLVEQPVSAWDLEGMARLRRHAGVPVLADESVQTVRDVNNVITTGAADVINLKILKLGGLNPTLRAAHIAEASGIAVKVGSMPELGIATLAAVHLTSALPQRQTPPDLVGPLLVRDEPYAPDRFAELAASGHMAVPNTPGLGHVPQIPTASEGDR